MNFDQEASPMGTKADELLNSSKGKYVSQSSDNDVHKLASSLGSLCSERHHTSSETSNLLSGCSHDSFSENAESKVNLRASNTSEDTGQKVAEDHSFVKSTIFHGEPNFSNRCGQQKESECFGDNISCISGSDNKNVKTERKNTPSRLASVTSFSIIETPDNYQPASCCVSSSPFCEVENSCPRRRDKFTNESSQTVAFCSNKSDLSENSSLKRESSECYEEQVESSLTRVAASRLVDQINDVNSNAECVKSDTEKTDGIVAGVVMKCPIRKEDFEKACGMADESDFVKSLMRSQPVDDKLNAVEVEVKVCDICGDTGWEDLLANCSKCSDGAEHIYCMRVKLDKIPMGDWLCEDCFLNEDSKKHIQDKFGEKIAMVASQPSLKKTMQNSGNLSALDQSNCLKLVNKNSGVKESRPCKVKSSPSFSSKRPANSLEAISVTKRRVLESIYRSGFFSPSRKMPLNSSFNKEKMKKTHEVTPSGTLSKSESFNTVHSKEKVQLSERGILKQNFARENAIINNTEERVARMMKSMSFNNASLGHTDVSDSKVVLSRSNSSYVKELKMLRRAKEKSLTETACSSKLHKPFICSPVPDSGNSASMTNQRIAHCGKTMPPHIDGDLVDVQHDEKSNNLSNSSSPLNNKPNEEQNRVFNDVGQHVLHSTGIAKTIDSNDSSTTLHPKKGPSLKDFSSFASVAAQPPWISVVPQLRYIWKGQFEIQGGRFLSACDGIQAHLSTCASPKVFEVVQKLPQKILLEEVPCSNKWPTQFLENHATEDNIALYVFASDIESYDRSYKDLLDCMIKNDLSLKGNFDGFELLLFASNLLPEKSQRWNNMLFLWGVFGGRRSNCSLELRNLHNTICSCSRNEVYLNRNQDVSDFLMSGSKNLCSSAHSSESLSASSTSYDVQQESKSSTLLDQLAYKRMAENCGAKTFSVEQKSVNIGTGPDCQQSCAYNAKTEYLFRHVSQTKSSERQEKGSERGQKVYHSFKEDSEHNVHSMRIDEERKCKRLKSCLSDVSEYNTSKNTKYLSETFPIGLNGLGPSFNENKHIGSEGHDTSFSRVEFKSSQPHVPIKDDGSKYMESEVLNLELSLRIEKGSTKQIALPPSYSETIQDKYSKPVTTDEKGDNKPTVSLSLSLALPSSSIDEVAKPCSETKQLLPEWHGVSTSLSL